MSTDDQDGAVQREALEQVSRHHGERVVAVFVESGSSWNKNARLPERDRLLALARAGKIDRLRVRDTYRLGRSAVEVYRLLEEFHQHRVSVLPIFGLEMNLETAMGRYVAMVMAASAEMESSLKSEVIRQKLAQRKSKGLPVGRTAGHRYKVDRHYSKVLPMLKRGLSYARICEDTGLNFRTVKAIEARAHASGDLVPGSLALGL